MAVPVGMPDHALLTRARDGDGEAFEALYRRHHRAATRAAHSYSSRSQLAEDAVQEAFMRILHATQEGGGPQTEFRAYLATTVRHVIAGWTRGERTIVSDDLEDLAGEDVRDTSRPESRLRWHLLTKAFKSLPTRWQEALWLGEVEGIAPAELAERWNMSANSAAALCYRARDGLRTAWLDAHVNEGLVPDECRPYVSDLSRYTQGKLTDRRETQVREHLDDCEYCRAVLFEVDVAASELRVLLLPVAMWGGLALAGAGLALGPLQTLGKALSNVGSRGLAVGAGATVTVAVVVVAAMNPVVADTLGPNAGGARPLVTTTDPSGGSTDDADDAGDGAGDGAADDSEDATTDPTAGASDSPTTVPVPDAGGSDGPAPTPTSSTPAGPPPNVPTSPAPTVPPVADPSDDPTEVPTDGPTDPTAPAAPVVNHRVTDGGAIELYGTGVPGATVSIAVTPAGTATAIGGAGATARSVPLRLPMAPVGTAVATTTVDGEGTWSVTPDLDKVAGLSVVATQTVNGRESVQSASIRLPARPAAPVIRQPAAPDGRDVVLEGTGTAGLTVQILRVGGGLLAEAEANESGSWQTQIALTAELGDSEIVAIQVGSDGLTSPRSTPVVLPSYVPPTDPEEPEDPEEPGELAELTLEVTVENGVLVFSGSGEPGASVTVTGDVVTAGPEIVGDDSHWRIEVDADPDLSGGTVVAIQTLGEQTSRSESRGIPVIEGPEVPETPAAPTVEVVLQVPRQVTLWGTAEPGAEILMRTLDGEHVGQSHADSELSVLNWTLGFWDERIADGGLTVVLYQVVDGVESPPSEPIVLPRDGIITEDEGTTV